jgi:hypothetical protein
MGQGYKPEDNLPNHKVRTKMAQTIQSAGTVIRSRLLSGDTLAMEDPQRVSCEFDNAV